MTDASVTEWAWVRRWRRMMDLAHVLWQVRAALSVLVVGAALLLGVDQVRELLARSVSTTGQGLLREIAGHASLAGAAMIWALASWFFSRSLLRYRFGHTPPWTETLERYAQAVPRWLGFLVLVVVALAMARAAHVARVEHGGGAMRLAALGAMYFALAGAFWFIVLARSGSRRLAPKLFLPYYFASRDGHALDFHSPLTTPEGELRRWATLAALATVYLFPLIVFGTTTVSSWWTAPTILVLALSQWCVFLSFSSYLWERFRLPVSALLVVLVACWSLMPGADNHRVRLLPSPPPERLSPEARAAEWITARLGDIERADSYPLYIIAAAGGGVRAAYWTAGALARVADRDPAFAAQVFAVSGVSGGALGAAMFAAQAASEAPAAPASRALQAATMLRQDFLTPVAITLLYPDLVHQIVPIAWALPAGLTDRATTLEKSWERAWREATGNDMLAAGYRNLQDRRRARPAPYLALTGTAVETGLPVTVGDFDFGAHITPNPGARDLFAVTGRDMALSTAAHLSARFTYVSPAATMVDANGRSVMHVVDGGYFENSGHHIAIEIARGLAACLDALEATCRFPAHIVSKIRPVLISLSNDPAYAARLAGEEPPPRMFLAELFSPLSALLETREGRGVAAERAARRFFEDRCWTHLALRVADRGVTLPLGWSLSANAADELDRQLDLATATPMRPAPRSACRTQSP